MLSTPVFCDCHTHLLFGGERSGEFARRMAGASYEEILKAGGGIHSTVEATGRTPISALVEYAMQRVSRLRRQGVGVIEVKSGYGLTVEGELRQLEAIAALREAVASENAEPTRNGRARLPVTIVPTLLLHTVPTYRRADRAEFLRELTQDLVPEAAQRKLAESLDVFCDSGAFSLEEAHDILQAGKKAGLRLRIHAEQLTHTGAAAMAAKLGATSADHLEMVDDEGIAAMAENDTVAVLLPGAQLVLNARKPPVEKLREAGVKIAVSTDCNPGSSPTTNLLLMMQLACVRMGLTAEEALTAVTSNALQAVYGKQIPADLESDAWQLHWDAEEPIGLIYDFGGQAEPRARVMTRL